MSLTHAFVVDHSGLLPVKQPRLTDSCPRCQLAAGLSDRIDLSTATTRVSYFRNIWRQQ